jgi:hypothetical protein
MNRRATIVVVLLAGLGLAAFLYATTWMGTHASGRARTAHFLGDASRVVIVDQQRTRDSPTIRVRVHDARTGAELVRERLRTGTWRDAARAMRETCFDCIPASPDRLWCCEMSGDDGLGLRSVDSLALVADEARLHQCAPGLAQGISREIGGLKPMVDLDDGALLVTGKDGRLYRIGVDLSAQMENLRLPAHAVGFARGAGMIGTAQLPGRTLRLEEPVGASKRLVITVQVPKDAGRQGFARLDAHLTAAEAFQAGLPAPRVAPHPDQTFLDAGFLADPDWGELKPVILEGSPALVLAHHELAKAGRQLILSRVDSEGELGWSRTLDDDEVRGARLVEGLIVVVLRDALVGIDAATGAVRYRTTF